MSKKTKLMGSLVMNSILCILEIIAFIISWSQFQWKTFQFYTQDSNIMTLFASGIMVAVTISTLVKNKGNDDNPTYSIPKWAQYIKYMAACCLSVTFLVVLFVLAPTFGPNGYVAMFFSGNMILLHFLNPILCVLSFVLFEREKGIPFTGTMVAMIPTVIYAIVSMVLNVLKVMYGPYPFLHVYEQPWYMSVVWVIVILGLAYGIAAALWVIKTKVGKKQ